MQTTDFPEFNCYVCLDKVIEVNKNTGELEICPHCANEESVIDALQMLIDEKVYFADKIPPILSNLPDYPVMAIMEAEHAGLHPNTIKLLKMVFNSRGLK